MITYFEKTLRSVGQEITCIYISLTNYLPSICTYMFLVFSIWSLRKSELWLLLNFQSKCIDMCRMDTVLPFILVVSEMLKIQKAKVETYSLKRLALQPTNLCYKMPSENVEGQLETFQNSKQQETNYVYKSSY